MENWLTIVVGVYLAGMVLYGHYKGFIRLAVSVVALIATLVIVNMAMPVVTNYLKDNEVVYNLFENSMKKAVGVTGPGDGFSPSEQRVIIENLNLPDQIKESLLENNNNEVYRLLGVDKFADYIIRYLSNKVINIVCFAVLFAVVSIVIHIIMRWLDLMARLPIINGMNKIAGAILGGAEALLVIWIICLVLPAFASTQFGIEVMAQIGSSKFLSFLYHNNFLNIMFLSAVHGLL